MESETSDTLNNAQIPDLSNEKAALYDVIKYPAQSEQESGSVTEGWADKNGRPAYPQVDFIEDEIDTLHRVPKANIPLDQQKYYYPIAVFAWIMFGLSMVALGV